MEPMPAAARLNSRRPAMFTFTLSLWIRKAHSRETSIRSSIENMRKAWNWAGLQDHSVSSTGIIGSVCGWTTRRTTGGVVEGALDSTSNFPIDGRRLVGLPSVPAPGPRLSKSRESVWLGYIHSDVEETCSQWHSTIARPARVNIVKGGL